MDTLHSKESKKQYSVSRRRFLFQAMIGTAGLAFTELLSPTISSSASGQPASKGGHSPVGGTVGSVAPTTYISRPAGQGPFPGVIVMQDWQGISESTKRTADRLAALGFVAVVPDLFEGRFAHSPQEALTIMATLDPNRIMTILRNTVTYLFHKESIAGSRVGIISSDFGSRYAIALSQQTFQVGGTFILNGLHIIESLNQQAIQRETEAENFLQGSHLFDYPISNGAARPMSGNSVRSWGPMLFLNPFLANSIPDSKAFSDALNDGMSWLSETLAV